MLNSRITVGGRSKLAVSGQAVGTLGVILFAIFFRDPPRISSPSAYTGLYSMLGLISSRRILLEVFSKPLSLVRGLHVARYFISACMFRGLCSEVCSAAVLRAELRTTPFFQVFIGAVDHRLCSEVCSEVCSAVALGTSLPAICFSGPKLSVSGPKPGGRSFNSGLWTIAAVPRSPSCSCGYSWTPSSRLN